MPTIPITNRCNNNCIMCTNPQDFLRRDGEFELPILLKRVENFRRGKLNEFLDSDRRVFYLTGGEPTMHPGLCDIAMQINRMFRNSKIILLTNGRIFSYKDYAKKLLSCVKNLEIVVSLHGHTAALHDKITRAPNSFTQTINGLHEIFKLRGPDQPVEIRVVIHRMNYRCLNGIIRFLKNRFPQINRLVLIFFEIEGQSLAHIKQLKLSYSEFAPYLTDLYGYIRHFPEFRVYHFPLCILPMQFYSFVWRTLPKDEVCFPNQCGGCEMQNFCLGVPKGYLDCFGAAEFRPVRKKATFIKTRNWYRPIDTRRAPTYDARL